MPESKIELYSPELAPEEYDSNFLQNELAKLQAIISILADGHLEKKNVVPDELYDGLIRYADGTNWNPGSGEGAYIYYNSTWNKLG